MSTQGPKFLYVSPPISADGEDTAQVDRIWSWVSSVSHFCSLYLLTCKISTDVCRSALVEHELVTLVYIHRWHLLQWFGCLLCLSFLPTLSSVVVLFLQGRAKGIERRWVEVLGAVQNQFEHLCVSG